MGILKRAESASPASESDVQGQAKSRQSPTRQRFTWIELLVACQPKPWRRPTQQRFTLIELLVVVSIIAILAAMLLPALESARKQAWRISCLSDRRQNYMQLNYFVNDHNDLLPHPVGNAKPYPGPDAARYTWLARTSYGASGDPGDPDKRLSEMARGGFEELYVKTTTDKAKLLRPLGVMAAFGYINVPENLFCPAFERRPRDEMNSPEAWYLDEHPDVWAEFRDGQYSGYETKPRINSGKYPFPKTSKYNQGTTLHAGIVHQFGYKSNVDVGMTDIALNWQDDDVSAVMFSCLNTVDGAVGGYKDKTYWGHPEMYLWGTSHQSEGMNDVFYDGSARWVSREEIKKEGILRYNKKWPDYLMNDTGSDRRANAYIWSLEYAKP